MVDRYETVDGSELPLLLFEPADGTRPAAGIVLFHGGALRTGSADGLAPHCRRLAARGIFAVSAGYRLLGQGAASIDDCVTDVRVAVGHFRRLAARRGLGTHRLASGGSSAGAHLALVAAMTAPGGPAPSGPAPAPDPGVAGIVALNPAGLDLLAHRVRAAGTSADAHPARHRRRGGADRARAAVPGRDGERRQRVHGARVRRRRARFPLPGALRHVIDATARFLLDRIATN